MGREERGYFGVMKKMREEEEKDAGNKETFVKRRLDIL